MLPEDHVGVVPTAELAVTGCTIEHVFEQGAAAVFDPAGLSDEELSVALREACVAVDRAEARRLVEAAEWDRRQAWSADGAYGGRC